MKGGAAAILDLTKEGIQTMEKEALMSLVKEWKEEEYSAKRVSRSGAELTDTLMFFIIQEFEGDINEAKEFIDNNYKLEDDPKVAATRTAATRTAATAAAAQATRGGQTWYTKPSERRRSDTLYTKEAAEKATRTAATRTAATAAAPEATRGGEAAAAEKFSISELPLGDRRRNSAASLTTEQAVRAANEKATWRDYLGF